MPTPTKPADTDQSFRGVLDALERAGDLHRVVRPVDPRFELGTVLSLRQHGPAQLFSNVTGHAMPVIGNVMNSRARIAALLGTGTASLHEVILDALASPIPPVVVDHAPVQEVVHREPVDLARLLPVPTWFEHETGPYITAGVIVAKDPETGRRNVSIARLRIDGGGRVMVGIAKNHHLNLLAEKARKLGQSLPIAVAIGNHPAVLLGSQMYLGLGDDEYDVVGGLLGAPLRLTRCLTVPLEVPAGADIVLEGAIDADDPVEEGAVSEFHGFYVRYGPGIGGTIACVTHRRDALYQAILPGYAPEHCLLGALAIEAVCCQALRRVIPAVRRVLVTDGGMGRLHAVIVMHRPRLGEGKRAIILAMGQINLLKFVVVVEDDVDPEDAAQVEWSLAARFRGGEDLVVLPGMKADRCDPVHENLTVTKIGLVACTRPSDGERGGLSEFARPPAGILAEVRADLDHY
ncbi:UbiD family decarboxylase [Labrys wisconsinensis]|uniref:UbiD family decarboxylase n=1 Tax=Labrys wisconsinensis TaxID=425677 RepID=A0ABU0JJZ8_9HYPH|nr:UbiD family decarboxylase [Labrys wisconsinensis]MDQ0474621.1 UbiD family decarboxylase [Labrys wisconsinensis]